MDLSRRGLAAGLATVALATKARADTTDLAVSCDTAAAPAVLRAADAFRARTGVRVRIFPTAPGLLVPQLQREIQNDIIFTRTEAIDAAEGLGLVKPGARTALWRNRLVIASQARPTGPEGSFAAPDPTPGSDIDGWAVLKAIGLAPAKPVGVLDTATAAWMLATVQVREALVFRSDVAARESLRIVATVPDAAAPAITYAATATTLAYRGDPAAFVAFLGSAQGIAELTAAGLERAA
jgi:molybdate transport system substrate-binding protein